MPKAKDAGPQKYHPTHHGPEIFSRRPPILTSAEKEWREEIVTFLLKRLYNSSANLSFPIEPTPLEDNQSRD